MAEIISLRAWRYNPQLSPIEKYTSPLFDVVSEEGLKTLYSNPLNSIHLSVPAGENPSEIASITLQRWKQEGVLLQDEKPAIYVYYQYFTIPGESMEYCRKGFICNIRVYDWSQRVIMRHENTIPSSVNDRIELLEATQFNVSPTHGLYSDRDFILEKLMDKSIKKSVYDTTDYQGVRDVVSIINDEAEVMQFVELMKDKQVILADGHHRYEGSLVYLKKKKSDPDYSDRKGYNFHMMYLTNLESEDVKVMATHRIIGGIKNFNEDDFLEQLQRDFHLQFFDRNVIRLMNSIKGFRWMFGIILPNYTLTLQLKEEAYPTMSWKFPEVIKSLDLTILHYFIVEKIVGIPGKEQRGTSQLTFERSLELCKEKVECGSANFAVLTNPVKMEEIKKVCYSGYTLPQKSTYFYPKVITGFVFSSIKDNEFTSTDFSI